MNTAPGQQPDKRPRRYPPPHPPNPRARACYPFTIPGSPKGKPPSAGPAPKSHPHLMNLGMSCVQVTAHVRGPRVGGADDADRVAFS